MSFDQSLLHLAYKTAAMSWLVIGQPKRAMALFNAMLQRWPGDIYALSSRANQHAQAGRRDLAILDGRRLVDLHPEAPAGHWFNLGFLCEAEQRLDEAELAFKRALELDPKLDRAWYGLGLALIGLGRHAEALAALKRNTELQPMSPFGWYQLARVHVDSQQPDEARKIIRHLKGFEPKVAAQLERETGLAA